MNLESGKKKEERTTREASEVPATAVELPQKEEVSNVLGD